MIMHEYHSEKPEVILMLHPMLASAETLYELVGCHLKDYRLLIPDLSAHGEAVGENYKSAALEAARIRDYMKEQGITRVRMAYGASLGGAVLMELLHLSGVEYGRLFFEGASLMANAPFFGKTMASMFVLKHRKAVEDPKLSAVKMAGLFGREMAPRLARQFINTSEESIRNAAYDCSHVHLFRLTEEQQRRCTFAYGAKDEFLKSARKEIAARYPAAQLIIWPGCGHCQKVTADPAAYTQELQKYL